MQWTFLLKENTEILYTPPWMFTLSKKVIATTAHAQIRKQTRFEL